MDVILWTLNAAHVIMRQIYFMMKEIFVYTVGMKLKKHYKKNANNIKKISY
jgi:hypothetical protein